MLWPPVWCPSPSPLRQEPVSLGPRRSGITRFVNLSGADEDRWVGAGIVEALAVDLSGLAGITVVGRENETPPAQPQASWRVTGSYQRVGEELRIIARLTDRGGAVNETVKIDGPFTSLFALQDQMAEELTARLQSRRMAGGPVPQPVSEGASSDGTEPSPAPGRDTVSTVPTAAVPGPAEAEPGLAGPAVAPTPSSRACRFQRTGQSERCASAPRAAGGNQTGRGWSGDRPGHSSDGPRPA